MGRRTVKKIFFKKDEMVSEHVATATVFLGAHASSSSPPPPPHIAEERRRAPPSKRVGKKSLVGSRVKRVSRTWKRGSRAGVGRSGKPLFALIGPSRAKFSESADACGQFLLPKKCAAASQPRARFCFASINRRRLSMSRLGAEAEPGPFTRLRSNRPRNIIAGPRIC